MAEQPASMPNSDAYRVTYADGTERTVWGYTIRYVADVSDDDPEHGDVVKIERVS